MKNCLILVLLLSTHLLAAQKPTVLLVLSAADTLALSHGQKKRPTGVFLNEMYAPYVALTQAGYAVAFTTPGGRMAAIDPESTAPPTGKSSPPCSKRPFNGRVRTVPFVIPYP